VGEQQNQPQQRYYIGWDVGAWHCDTNKNSRDAVAILDHTLKPVGEPWRGNLSSLILSLQESNESQAQESAINRFLEGLFRLCLKETIKKRVKSEMTLNRPTKKDRATHKKRLEAQIEREELDKYFPTQERPVYCIAIDTPLGWPVEFRKLLDSWLGNESGVCSPTTNQPNQRFDSSIIVLGKNKIGNPLLHRQTETNFGECLSAIQDMIGSQSTKAICLLLNIRAKRVTTGVWKIDHPDVTFIESYPAPCMRSFAFIDEMKAINTDVSVKTEDTLDAIVCAMIAKEFSAPSRNVKLTTPSIPNDAEGWIFTPNEYLDSAYGVSYGKLVKSNLGFDELLTWVQLGIVMKAILQTMGTTEDAEAASECLPAEIIDWLKKCEQTTSNIIRSATSEEFKKYYMMLNPKKSNSDQEQEAEKGKPNKDKFPTASQFEEIARFIKKKAVQ
jgi:hypothetical protein